VTTASESRPRRLGATLREESRVTPLELFFDLVFVLALTQCTALMADEPTWEGLVKGLLILGVLWWCWVGYAWLTSVVNPEEGAVRLAMFAAMAGLLVVALCVPGAFGDEGLLFAIAYASVRLAHIALFVLASRDDPGLRHAVWGLLASTVLGTGLLVSASFADGLLQGGLWALALTLDMGGPLLIDPAGWRLEPSHFAERHGLILIIALGESIVAVGVGAEAGVDGGVITVAVLGTALAAALWWAYFDVVALVAERRLSRAAPGKEQNELARDSYSFLHYPMVAGIVLIALGIESTIAHVGERLHPETAFALVGGVAVYLLAHVAFRLRNVGTISKQRLLVAVVLLALAPLGDEVHALVTLAVVTGVLWTLIAYEAIRFADGRDQVRHAQGDRTPS
jgi:low temperature requirement protein LtrA